MKAGNCAAHRRSTDVGSDGARILLSVVDSACDKKLSASIVVVAAIVLAISASAGSQGKIAFKRA